MITRIKINGFKSLVDTDLYLGPFTCIAGANAIGKSNFFDALVFLSHLADDTILQAVKAVRSENQKHSNIRDIFFRNGSEYLKEMSFEIDMIIPKISEDDLGQVAEATITSLKYCLRLKLNESIDGEAVEIVSEELKPLTQTETKKNIFFDYNKDWLSSVLDGRRSTAAPFISVDVDKIRLHQDGSKGRTTDFIAKKMPRTLLSTVTAESPTAFLARQEIRNWTMLQFEPSALRQPNSVYEVKNAEITANGLNLPATLYRLHSDKKDRDIYQILTNKLKGLVEDVNEITIDKDEKRDLLTLQIGFKGGLILPAQSLSDGTLRFLGLAIIEEDSMSSGLICLEEPENGINPKKVLEMVNLLKGIATDTDYPVDENNPLRQVIINTHSPIVVSAVPDESLYLAKGKESFISQFNRKIKSTGFSALKDTWKTKQNLADETTYGEISAYLDNESSNQIVEEPIIIYTKKQRRTVSQNINSQYPLF
jgi:predicted ATPase